MKQSESSQDQRLEELEEHITRFPNAPGVYIMRNKDGEVLYVGKAKNLRVRVRSYFRGGDGRHQIAFLMARVHSIDTTLTDSDDQAYILERQLINKHKPRYNIRLKDDKSYLSIKIQTQSPWPRLQLVRQVRDDGARYFGPYRFAHEARSLLEIVNNTIPLRSCSDTVFSNRQRPCLEYQIKRCAGPCCLEVDREEYDTWVHQAMQVLQGDVVSLKKQLEKKMEEASDALRFEDAALYRDRITLLDSVAEGQQYVSTGTENRDVIGIYRVERLAAVCVLQVRFGRITDSDVYAFESVEVDDATFLESVLEQYYRQGKECPDEIVLPSDLEDDSFLHDVLQKIRGKKVPLLVPQRGLKFRLLKLSELNAKQHYISTYDAEARYQEIARTLSKKLRLEQVPRRIECLDISNFQGSDIVGAIVCFFDGEPDKASYRKYVLSSQGKPDDFASVHEVVLRRLERGFREDTLPDLLIIDGGKGQLSAALEARDSLGIDLPIVALAKMRAIKGTQLKKPERFFIEGLQSPIVMPPEDKATHFVARLRDEVHRYVISFHRSRRHHRVFGSLLDTIPGIGEQRKKRLLQVFGSLENISRHKADEIAQGARIPLRLAEAVLQALQTSTALVEEIE